MHILQNTNLNFNVFHLWKIKIGKGDELKGIIKFIAGQGYQATPTNPKEKPEFFSNIKAAQKFLMMGGRKYRIYNLLKILKTH